jgi:cell division septation protein DedD
MTSKGNKSGGDFVLESRHLLGLFLLLVVIFGVVFTLGYLLGRSQFDTKLQAAAVKTVDDVDPPPAAPVAKSKAKSKAKADNEDAAPPPAGSDWDFYHSADAKTTEDHLQPPPVKNVSAKQPVDAPKPAAAAKTARQDKAPAPLDAPLIPKGKIMLQVAAVTSEGDALALAQALQQKKFSAFVIPPSKSPGSDKFYRIQVGPYADSKSASAARQDLEAKGFKSIVKR